ncbi:hypothetical protein WJX84_005736 [Apatococcus fuscideae]|uniref:Uncharacterized protein n=1 Tax=Apatococcus fuscideae TaxID=2026836 RepID=A0AAW1TD03_9CHLO
MDEEKHDLRKQITELVKQKEDLVTKAQQWKGYVETVQAYERKLDYHADALQRAADEQKHSEHSSLDMLNQANYDREVLTIRLQEKTDEYEATSQACTGLEADLRESRQESAARQSDLDDHKQRLAGLENQLNTSQMNGQRLDKTVSGLQHRQQELEEWLAETQSEQENLKAEVQQQKDLLQEQRDQLGKFEKLLQESDHAKAALESDLAAEEELATGLQQQQLQDAQAKIKSLEASLSKSRRESLTKTESAEAHIADLKASRPSAPPRASGTATAHQHNTGQHPIPANPHEAPEGDSPHTLRKAGNGHVPVAEPPPARSSYTPGRRILAHAHEGTSPRREGVESILAMGMGPISQGGISRGMLGGSPSYGPQPMQRVGPHDDEDEPDSSGTAPVDVPGPLHQRDEEADQGLRELSPDEEADSGLPQIHEGAPLGSPTSSVPMEQPPQSTPATKRKRGRSNTTVTAPESVRRNPRRATSRATSRATTIVPISPSHTATSTGATRHGKDAKAAAQQTASKSTRKKPRKTVNLASNDLSTADQAPQSRPSRPSGNTQPASPTHPVLIARLHEDLNPTLKDPPLPADSDTSIAGRVRQRHSDDHAGA